MKSWPDTLPDAWETAAQIARGALTAERAVRQRLEVIASLEPRVGAWVAVDEEGALAAARTLDAGPGQGALHGVPMGIKDIFAAKGLPWRCGSPIWKDRVAHSDAGSVALARAAGAVILGKTETTEFASYTPARTRNPWDAARTPGGSSSGSAAGVACGMMPLAFGTQTSGSIIRPASYCGIVGYKPSFDLIEPGGVSPLARSLDTIGLFARSVRDVALGARALTRLDLTPEAADAPHRLAVYRSAVWDEAEPAMVAAWQAFEESLGDGRTDHTFPSEVEAMLARAPALHARIMAAEAGEALAFEYATAADLLSPALRAHLEEGRALSAEDRARDWREMRALRHAVDAALPADAVWLTPAATGPAPDFDAGTGSPAFNRVWTLLGLPCCTVPLLQSEAGMPMGVQVVGAMGNDRGVLSVADMLMARFGPA